MRQNGVLNARFDQSTVAQDRHYGLLLEVAESAGWDRQHAALAIVALASGRLSEDSFLEDRALS